MNQPLYEIPFRIELCYHKNKGILLPENVPYLGMGAAYIATKVFRYFDINFYPEKAAEYFEFLLKFKRNYSGVLISWSGKNAEVLRCADFFHSFVAISNNAESALTTHPACRNTIELFAGSTSHTIAQNYLNTLLVLYLGHGFDPSPVIPVFKKEMDYYEGLGRSLEHFILKNRRTGLKKRTIYILGDGPNNATADVAALELGKALKCPVLSMSTSHFQQCYSESASNSLLIFIDHSDPSESRYKSFKDTMQSRGAVIFELNNTKVDSILSPLTLPVPFFFAADFLKA